MNPIKKRRASRPHHARHLDPRARRHQPESFEQRRPLADTETETLAPFFSAFKTEANTKRWVHFDGAIHAGDGTGKSFRPQQRHFKYKTEHDRVAQLSQVVRSPDDPPP